MIVQHFMVNNRMVGINQSQDITALDGGSPYGGDQPVHDITALDGE
jgi:hypothetical protein